MSGGEAFSTGATFGRLVRVASELPSVEALEAFIDANRRGELPYPPAGTVAFRQLCLKAIELRVAYCHAMEVATAFELLEEEFPTLARPRLPFSLVDGKPHDE